MVVQHKKTIDDFEDFLAQTQVSDRLYELIDGEIVEKMTTEEHGVVAVNVSTSFKLYARPRGDRVAVEARHRTTEDNANDRLPDVSYTLQETALPLTRKGAVLQMPTVAVEIKSPTDSYTKLRDKAAYYLAHGVRMVWLIFPEKRIVEVYEQGRDLQIFIDGDIITGGAVLPNFEMTVADVFEGT